VSRETAARRVLNFMCELSVDRFRDSFSGLKLPPTSFTYANR
jgi:hypothetical protein